jgi:hypothetical protein
MRALFCQVFPGMEFVPLLVLLIALGAIASLASLTTAFFSRRIARVLASLAGGAVLASGLTILATNKWDLYWLVSVLASGLPPVLLLWASVLLSLIAAVVPLAPSPDGKLLARGIVRNRWFVCLFVCIPILLLAGWGGLQINDDWVGDQKTRALVSGSQQVRFARVQIDYQQRRVICTDPVVLRYLEERFRNHGQPRNDPSTTYQLTIEYEGGGRHAFGTYWYENGFSLALLDDENGDGHIGISLPRPLPSQVEEIVQFLGEPWRQVKGTVLVVEPGSIHRHYDQSLVVEP